MAIEVKMYVAIATLCFVGVFAEEMMLNINVKKPMAVVSDKFLSITLDPVVLFNSDSLSDMEKSTNMAKALAPAYVRIAGPRSNSFVFDRSLYSEESNADPGNTFTEKQWLQVHQWAERSGLDVITSLAPQPQQQQQQKKDVTSKWDPRNAFDLISFSDRMGYNDSWQLGYECQTQCADMSGSKLGRYVQNLRNVLDAFPRYSENGLLIGPDIVSWKTRQQQQYLQDFFSVATSSLSAVTWHPDFASVSLESEGVSMHQDDLALDKDSLFRVVGRFVFRKPLWLAESKPEECKRQFLGALVWARRLGNAAKLGAQVVMRQPESSNLFRPSPDYWVSVLHKMLVGRQVLDTRIFAGNRTHVNFYGHCTRPSSKYEAGSLTIFGINLTPGRVTVNPKGLKIKLVHKYILLPGHDATNRMFAETVLLNNEALNLGNGKGIPDMQPVIVNSDRGVKLKLPSGGIGFWVLPDLKIKSCMNTEEENLVQRGVMTKPLEDFEIDVESEPEYVESREAEVSVEDKKSPVPINKRQLLRRTSRHSRDEPEPRPKHGIDRNQRKSEVKSPERQVKNDENSSEESFIRSVHQRPKIGLVPRFKALQKKRQTDEVKRKEQRAKLHTSHVKNEAEDSDDKSMDTEKVIEALTLITKVEKGMGSNDTSIGSADSKLLDEVLNTEKSKKTSVPENIEDQLKALYTLLSEKKDKSQSTPRQRRDIDRRQNEAIFVRRRARAEEELRQLKERRQKRLQELKQRIRERHEQRHGKPILSDDSEEDEFYDEPKYEPAFIRDRHRHPRSGKVKRVPKLKADARTKDDGLGDYMPHEFYENVKLPLPEYDDNHELDEYSSDDVKSLGVTTEHPKHEAKARLSKHEDLKTEEKSADPSYNHYQSKPNAHLELNQPEYKPIYQTAGKIDYTKYQAAPTYQQTPSSYPFGYQNPASQTFPTLYQRKKRESNNLEDILDWEMIAQDDSNLKDCQCRVIRGVPECKNCQNRYNPVLEPMLFPMPEPVYPYRPIFMDPNHSQIEYLERMRERRNLKDPNEEVQLPLVTFRPVQIQPEMPKNQGKFDVQMSTTAKARSEEMKVKSQIKQEPQKSIPTKTRSEETKLNIQEKQDLQNSTSVKTNIEETKPESQKVASLKTQGKLETDKSTSNVEETKRVSTELLKAQTVKPAAKGETKEKSQDKIISMEKQETQGILSATMHSEKSMDTQKSKRQEPEEVAVTEESLENSPEFEIEEVTSEPDTNKGPFLSDTEAAVTVSNNEDMLNLENQGDKLTPNRLPRKIGDPPMKFFLYKNEGQVTPASRRNHKIVMPAKKKNYKTLAQETSTVATNVETRPVTRSTGEASDGLIAKARRASDTNTQLPSATIDKSAVDSEDPSKIKINSQPTAETKNIFNTKESVPSVVAKNESKTAKPKTRAEAANTRVEKKPAIQAATEPNSPTKPKSRISSQPSADSKSNPKTAVSHQTDSEENSRNEEKLEAKQAEPKNTTEKEEQTTVDLNKKSPDLVTEKALDPMTKARIASPKPEEFAKARQARLALRSQALAALRKENENKRAKKMIESRIKVLESEHARFEEYEKRYKDQLDRLKLRLRAKREKMLHQYRDELLEVVHENSDSKESSLHQRDLVVKTDSKSAEKKCPAVMNKPRISFILKEKTNEVFKKPNHRSTPEKKMYKHSRKRSLSPEDQFEFVPLTNDGEQENQSMNEEITDDFADDFPVNRPNRQLPEDFALGNDNFDLHDYVSHEQPKEFNSYQEYQTYQDQESPTYQLEAKKQNKFFKNQEKQQTSIEEELQNFEEPLYEPQTDYGLTADPVFEAANNKDNLPEPKLNYYSENPDDYYDELEINPPAEKDEEDSAEKSNPKSKRSDVGGVAEVDTYEEDDPNFELRELYSEPSYYRRSYRDFPYEYNTGRFRREIIQSNGDNLDTPLSFSLSLDKSKMKKKSGVAAVSSRKKRDTSQMPNETHEVLQARQLVNKNIKKFYKNPSLKQKKLKSVNKKLSRRKRSLNDESLCTKFASNNEINPEDSEMDEVLSNIVAMKRDEKLLNEFDIQKSKLIENYRKNQEGLNKFIETTGKNITFATEKIKPKETDLEAIITDAMPKIESVITGNIKKAQNFSESLEDFIENFENDEEESTLLSDEKGNSNGTTYTADDTMSGHVFVNILGKVRKIFDIISNFTRTFQSH